MPPLNTYTKDGMKTVEFDLSPNVVIWHPFPEPVYTLGMEQKNRIKLTTDHRNGEYILIFMLVNTENGKETETELRRMVFPDKETILEFKQNFLAAFEKHGL
jgi:hypothetical protein